MGEIIHLPDRDQQELLVGLNDFKEENWQGAIDLLEPIYRQHPFLELNQKLVISYDKLHDYELAYDFLNEYSSEYLSDNEGQMFYVNFLIDHQQFIDAWQTIAKLAQKSHNRLQIRNLTSLVQRAEETIDPASVAQLTKKLHFLGAENIYQQQKILKDIRHLPKQIYVDEVKKVILDNYLHPLLRGDLVEELVKLDYQGRIDFYFFTEKRNVDISNLPLIWESEKVKETAHLIQAQNDVFEEVWVNELNLYAAMLYPLTDEIIDPIGWTAMLTDQETVRNTLVSSEMKEWQIRLQRALQELTQ